jgi:hypothetical protein
MDEGIGAAPLGVRRARPAGTDREPPRVDPRGKGFDEPIGDARSRRGGAGRQSDQKEGKASDPHVLERESSRRCDARPRRFGPWLRRDQPFTVPCGPGIFKTPGYWECERFGVE